MFLRKAAITGILLLATLTVALQSSLCPWTQNIPAADSSVFLTIAQGILDGKLPYVHFFDHKGPLLYFINCLGLALGGLDGLGVWGLQFALLFVSAVFAYKTARLFSGNFASLLVVTVSFVVLSSIYEQGNFPEEYALPLIFISLFLYSGHFFGKFELTRWKTVAIGACFGASLMLKPNLFSVWLGFSTILLIRGLQKKDYIFLLRHAAFFSAGTGAVLLPCLGYLLATNTFSAYIEQCYLFNFAYANHALLPEATRHGGYSGGIGLLAATFVHVLKCNKIWFILLYLVTMIIRPKERRYYTFAILLSLLTGILFLLKSPMSGPRNYMVLIPFFIPALANLSNAWIAMSGKKYYLNYLLTAGLLAGIFSQEIFSIGPSLSNSFSEGYDRKNPLSKIKLQRILKSVDGKLGKNDTITVFGNNCSLYLYSGIPDRKSVV
jgi:hypothetical protein